MKEKVKGYKLDEGEEKDWRTILPNCRAYQLFVQTSVYMYHWGQKSSENQFPDTYRPKCGKKSAIGNVEGRVTNETIRML